MWIGHRKEIRKLTFRALALRRSGWDAHDLICWDAHVLTLEEELGTGYDQEEQLQKGLKEEEY